MVASLMIATAITFLLITAPVPCGAISEVETDEERAKVQACSGEIELKAKQHLAAVKLFKEAAALAGDNRALRRRYLDLRTRAAAEGKMKAELERIKEVRVQDALLESAQRKRGLNEKDLAALEEELDKAAALYRTDRDQERAELARAIRVLVAVRSGKAEAADEARAIVDNKKRGKSARKVALEALWSAGETTKDLELAASSALELNAMAAEARPIEQRRYVRASGLDALCARYDAENKLGACTRLEKKLTGDYTFTDLSRGAAKRELTDADLARVHAQLLPAIEDCVLSAAKKAVDLFANSDVEIAWAIQPKGSVSDVEIVPKRLRPDLEACVGERLSWARYPRYTSQERKAVRVPYHLDERIPY